LKKKTNKKPTKLMSQIIIYRNRDKGINVKLGNPMTESHDLDIKKSHLRLLMLANRMAWDTQQGCC
jgi:hypothetical protein